MHVAIRAVIMLRRRRGGGVIYSFVNSLRGRGTPQPLAILNARQRWWSYHSSPYLPSCSPPCLLLQNLLLRNSSKNSKLKPRMCTQTFSENSSKFCRSESKERAEISFLLLILFVRCSLRIWCVIFGSVYSVVNKGVSNNNNIYYVVVPLDRELDAIYLGHETRRPSAFYTLSTFLIIRSRFYPSTYECEENVEPERIDCY